MVIVTPAICHSLRSWVDKLKSGPHASAVKDQARWQSDQEALSDDAHNRRLSFAKIMPDPQAQSLATLSAPAGPFGEAAKVIIQSPEPTGFCSFSAKL